MARLAIQLAGTVAGGAIGGPIGASIGSAIGAGVGSLLFPPPDVNTYGPRLTDASVTTSTYGAFCTIIYGTAPTSGNIIDAPDRKYEVAKKETEDGKGGQEVSHTTYSYYVDLAIFLSDSPIEGVLMGFADETLIYDARPGSTFVKPSWLNITVYNGTADQMPDSTLEAIHGVGNVPGYRNQSYLVLRYYPLGQSGRIPMFRWVVAGAGTKVTADVSIDVNPFPWTTTAPNPTAGFSNGPIYSSRTGLAYASVENFDYDETAIVAFDPYSKNIIWSANGREIPTPFEGLVSKGAPQFCGDSTGLLGQHIVINGRPSTGTGAWNRALFIDAETGYQRKLLGLASSAYSTEFTYSLYENKILLLGQINANADVAMHSISGVGWSEYTITITPPSGWSWELGNKFGVKPGTTTDNAVVIGNIKSGSDFGLALWTDMSSLDATPYEPNYTVYDLGTDYIQLLQAKYDSVRECFWIICRTDPSDYIAFVRVPIDGSAHTAYDWNSLYSSTAKTAADDGWFGDDFVNGYIWVRDTSDDVWRWDIVNLTAPVEYSATTVSRDWSFMSATGGMWGSHEDKVVEYQFDRLQDDLVTLSSIVDDICDRSSLPSAMYDTSDLDSTDVRGYAVERQITGRGGIEPLRQGFLFEHSDAGAGVVFKKLGQSITRSLTIDDIGAHPVFQSAPVPLKISQIKVGDTPKQLDVKFMDVDANYEIGTQPARSQASRSNQTISIELPIVLTHSEAAQKAEILLHLSRIERESYELQLMPVHNDLIPTDVISVNDGINDYRMRILEKTFEDGIVKVKAVRDEPAVLTSLATGIEITDRDVSIAANGLMQFELLNIPPLRDEDMVSGFYVAAYSYTPGWPGGVIFRSTDQANWGESMTVSTQSAVGRVWSVPSDVTMGIPDDINSLSLTLYTGSLESVTLPQIIAGRVNVAAYGAPGRMEIIQFTTQSLGTDGLTTISGLLRGRLGTDRHVNAHEVGDVFVLLDESTIRYLTTQESNIGSTFYYRGVTFGQSLYDDNNIQKTHQHVGAGLLCYAPANFRYYTASDLDIVFNWDERTRRIWRSFYSGLSSDPGDYEIDIINGAGTVVRTISVSADTVTYTRTEQETDFGAGTEDTVTARIYQVNDTGRGNYADLTTILGQHQNQVYTYAMSLNPSSFWSMNTDGTPQVNYVTGGPDLNLSGTYSTGESPGLAPGASVLLGSGAYGQNDDGVWGYESQTWSMLLKVSSSPAGDIVFANFGDSQVDIRLTLTTTRTVKFGTILSTVLTEVESTTALTTGQWYLITASIGAAGMKLYVDGTSEDTDTPTSWDYWTGGNTHWRVGDNPSISQSATIDMYYDQVMLWHGTQLSDSEVAGLAARMV